jgi:hypothetical protein
MTAFAIVVTVDPEGHLASQLLWGVQGLGVVVKIKLVSLLRRNLRLEGGEEAFRRGVIPAVAFG